MVRSSSRILFSPLEIKYLREPPVDAVAYYDGLDCLPIGTSVLAILLRVEIRNPFNEKLSRNPKLSCYAKRTTAPWSQHGSYSSGINFS